MRSFTNIAAASLFAPLTQSPQPMSWKPRGNAFNARKASLQKVLVGGGTSSTIDKRLKVQERRMLHLSRNTCSSGATSIRNWRPKGRLLETGTTANSRSSSKRNCKIGREPQGLNEMTFLAPIAGPLAIAGAGISAIGTIEQGEATSNAASYQAQVAQNNAIIAEQNATYASNAGLAQAAATSLKGASQAGKVKTAQAASGIDVNTGSAVNVQASERETNVLNSETVLNNAELQNYGYRAAATGYKATAGLEEEEAAQAPVGAALSATGNLLSAASSIGAKWPQPASQPFLGVSDQTNPTAIGGLY
jgi:hypothetical protein